MTLPFNPLARLRPFPSHFPSLACDSDTLIDTDVPSSPLPRTHFLSSHSTSSTPPPVIARSAFIPDSLVEHLMRNKRDSAITTKYLPDTAITNAEAAMHSFVTALVVATQCGDYAWKGGHTAVELGTSARGRRLGRKVVVSTALHNDFEDSQVAEVFFALEDDELVGRDLRLRQGGARFVVPSAEEKNHDAFRRAYDETLRQHAVYHLLPERRLPSLHELAHRPWTVDETISRLVAHLQTPLSSAHETPTQLLSSRSIRLSQPSSSILSLSFLLATHITSLTNELSALEALTADKGYIYTYQPPSIFARRLPAEVSVLLVFCALREVQLAAREAGALKLDKMRAFALSTHTSSLSSLFPLLSLQLPSHILSLHLSSLFPAPSHLYAPPPSLRGATLVIHNNSDAFGQNIESEESGGSLDGVVGCWGDASRALRRERGDLVRFVG
ncbi:hypothetical protein RTBOTA2_005243 [Rhodotorula toruloides]|uniref:Uncharacterized protein n=2 Tax=Rhodotorula toruloides TaxID=5286 RepID=A0A2T0A874_RHOTO|nr:hypothetical protein RTBOTA2_005243 [Rhodotorula toruloides]PRQ74189.1 hypothetical protein AAT19DRAFT_14542 [Rhodotorula toruloides]